MCSFVSNRQQHLCGWESVHLLRTLLTVTSCNFSPHSAFVASLSSKTSTRLYLCCECGLWAVPYTVRKEPMSHSNCARSDFVLCCMCVTLSTYSVLVWLHVYHDISSYTQMFVYHFHIMCLCQCWCHMFMSTSKLKLHKSLFVSVTAHKRH